MNLVDDLLDTALIEAGSLSLDSRPFDLGETIARRRRPTMLPFSARPAAS